MEEGRSQVANFWDQTEDTVAQNQAINALSKYTALFLGRLQQPDLALTSGKGIQSKVNLCGAVGTGKGNADKSETGGNGSGTKDNLKDIWEIGGDTVPLERLIQIFDKDVVSSASMDWSKPTFFGMIPGSSNLMYAAADYIASLTRVMPFAPFVNTGACAIEESVVTWVKGIVGYPDTSNGVTVSGSSMGAVVAFSAARDHLLPSSDFYKKAVVYVAEHTHFSSIRALRVAGLGNCVNRSVPSVKHRMVADTLKAMITEDTEKGLMPFMVIATMGGMCMGALDPFDQIRTITRKHNI